MAINRVSFTAQSILDSTSLAIEMLQDQPDTQKYLDTQVTPNVIVGFYNDITDTVELYMTDNTGFRYIKVQ